MRLGLCIHYIIKVLLHILNGTPERPLLAQVEEKLADLGHWETLVHIKCARSRAISRVAQAYLTFTDEAEAIDCFEIVHANYGYLDSCFDTHHVLIRATCYQFMWIVWYRRAPFPRIACIVYVDVIAPWIWRAATLPCATGAARRLLLLWLRLGAANDARRVAGLRGRRVTWLMRLVKGTPWPLTGH